MSPQGFALVTSSAVFTMAANLLMRNGILRTGGISLTWDGLTGGVLALLKQPLFLLGAGFYALAAVTWFHVLPKEDLSTSYPTLVSVTFLLVTLGAVIFFHERISGQKLLGLAVILSGVILVARA